MAQLMTATHRTGDRARRATGAALLSVAGSLTAVGLAVAQPGFLRLLAAPAATVLLLASLVKLAEVLTLRRRERMEAGLIGSLVARLPQQWYVLGDLEIEPSWLEPVHIWAVVVGPGGLAVVQPCSEAGDLIPCGHVWTVRQGSHARAIPSPAGIAWTAAEALREVLGTEQIPVVPVVALTDLNAIFHQAETGAHVVGGPHLADGLRRWLGGGRSIWDSVQLSAFLASYHR